MQKTKYDFNEHAMICIAMLLLIADDLIWMAKMYH